LGHGYHNTTLCTGGKMKRYRTHVLVALAFVPNPDGKPQVNHKDGVKGNNYYENLEWVTASENQQHSIAHGLFRKSRGTANTMATLTDAQVLEMRDYAANGVSLRTLAEEYHIHYQTAYKIVNRKRWTHI
jgi:hypothetical protein